MSVSLEYLFWLGSALVLVASIIVAKVQNLRSGDIANIIVLVVTLTFVIGISLNVSEKVDFIATSYIQEGFCVSWEN
jgi:hypothetical protein